MARKKSCRRRLIFCLLGRAGGERERGSGHRGARFELKKINNIIVDFYVVHVVTRCPGGEGKRGGGEEGSEGGRSIFINLHFICSLLRITHCLTSIGLEILAPNVKVFSIHNL